MKVKDINKLMEQLHKDKREAFSKHEVWLMLSEHNTEVPTVDVVPSEDRPIVIRSRTFMPTKDFKEWAKRIREENPNAIVIPCDAEVVSANRPTGEWIQIDPIGEFECSQCG